jgi:hypothetical protein
MGEDELDFESLYYSISADGEWEKIFDKIQDFELTESWESYEEDYDYER